MSLVTTVQIISTIVMESNRNIEKINNWLTVNDYRNLFREVPHETSAGDKSPQCCLFWGGFNYFNTHEFIEFFKSLKWNGAILIIGDEDADNGWRIILGGYDEYEDYHARAEIHLPDKTDYAIKDNVIFTKKASPIVEYIKESNDYFNNLEKGDKIKECFNCEKEFTTTDPEQNYCDKCAKKYYNCGCSAPYCLCYTR